MSILRFCDELISILARSPVPSNIRNETEFEVRFIIAIVIETAAHFPHIQTFTHPWKNKRRCQPDCETAAESHNSVAGCPRCWTASKRWATVSVFGTHHTFDAMARDRSGKTLAVEAKFFVTNSSRRPNGEIQRLLGQCSLAKSKHDYVVGVCACRGGLDLKQNKATESVTNWFEKTGIRLVFCSVC